MGKLNFSFIRTKFHLILLAVFAVLPYLNILGNGFVWDDNTFINNWPEIKTINPLLYLKGILPAGHGGVWRPLRTFAYGLSYAVFGTNPFWYHLQSLILHLLIVILLYFVLRKLFSDKNLSFLTSLIFAVHPVHTEAVSFLTASFDLYTVLFYLIAVLLFLKYLEKKAFFWLSITVIFTTFAFLSGEMALTLPVIFILAAYFSDRSFKKSLAVAAPFFLLLITYFLFRFLFLKIPARQSVYTDNIILWLFMLKALTRYISILFFPLSLSVSYNVSSSNIIITASDKLSAYFQLIDVQILVGLIIILISLFLLFRLSKKSLAFFALVWFFVTLAPVSNIFPSNTAVAERYLYLPSIGFVLVVAYFLLFLYQSFLKSEKSYWMKVAFFFIWSLVILLSGRTYLRNRDWKSNLTLWNQTVKVSPDSSLAHNNLGQAYATEKDYPKALDEFQKALDLNSQNLSAYNNTGEIYLLEKNYDQAASSFKKGLKNFSDDPNLIIGLAKTYTAQDNINDAIDFLKEKSTAVSNAQIYSYLALLYLNQGKSDLAESLYRQAINTDPRFSLAYNNLAMIFISKGDYLQAEEFLLSAIRLKKDDPEYLYNLANIYIKLKKPEEAREIYNQIIKIDSHYPKAPQILQKLSSG